MLNYVLNILLSSAIIQLPQWAKNARFAEQITLIYLYARLFLSTPALPAAY